MFSILKLLFKIPLFVLLIIIWFPVALILSVSDYDEINELKWIKTIFENKFTYWVIK